MALNARAVNTHSYCQKYVVLKCCFNFHCDQVIWADSSLRPKTGDIVIADVGGETEIGIFRDTYVELPTGDMEWIFQVEAVVTSGRYIRE